MSPSISDTIFKIKQELAAVVASHPGLVVASFCANGDDIYGGYVIRADGAMLPYGELQHGFTHLDQMVSNVALAETHKDSLYLWDALGASEALEEAPALLGALEPVIYSKGEYDMLVYGMLENFPQQSKLVKEDWRAGRLSVENVFELLSGAPGYPCRPGTSGVSSDVTVRQDVYGTTLGRQADGTLAWTRHLLASAGQTVKGEVRFDETSATVNFAGGHVVLPYGAFVGKYAPPSAESVVQAHQAWAAAVAKEGIVGHVPTVDAVKAQQAELEALIRPLRAPRR